ncbi:MAG: sporulation protein YqfD [Clostridia bacterium]|nr:sporulation protein YqfD [Clostridia bacterium]
MKLKIITFIKGSALIRAEGSFCERVINIARENGIFVWNIRRVDDVTITFFVSRKAAAKLLSLNLPEGLTITRIREDGLFGFLSRFKKRRALLICPFAALLLLFLSTQIIWNVNVVTDDAEEEAIILSELAELGLKRGTLKMTIDQSELKRRMILTDDSLLWIWVDIKGSTAIVRLAERTAAPEIFDENAYYNIYSSSDAVITQIIARSGIARINVGDTVLKGQLLIEGLMQVGEESAAPVHASGTVMGSVWHETEVKIPKQNEIHTPTGLFDERLTIKIFDFSIKLFINSRISYQSYDIIEYENSLTPVPISFIKQTVREVDVIYEQNDTDALIAQSEDEFSSSLSETGLDVTYVESLARDMGDYIAVTHRALCSEDVAVERRMNIGKITNSAEP